jgi:hypothetical protein
MPVIRCHACNTAASIPEPVPRDAECASCGADLRCCLNCRHHDVAYNNQCRETEADPVADKDRRNFCEFFSARAEGARGASSGGLRGASSGSNPSGFTHPPVVDRAAEARKALDRLFGGGSAGSKPKPVDDDDDA